MNQIESLNSSHEKEVVQVDNFFFCDSLQKVTMCEDIKMDGITIFISQKHNI